MAGRSVDKGRSYLENEEIFPSRGLPSSIWECWPNFTVYFWADSPLLKTAKNGSGNWVDVFLDESVPK